MRRLAWLLGPALIAVVAVGQDSVRDELLGPLDLEMERARKEGLNLLSPRNFEKATKSHKKAQEDYRRGRKLETIRKSIGETEASLKLAFESAGVARVALTDALAVRQEVLQFRPLVTRSEFWKAEDEVKKAGGKIERDDLKGARKHGTEAERRYRRTALEYLRNDLLRDAKDGLKASRGVISKEEYQAAEKRLKELENEVKKLKDKDPFSVADVVGDIQRQLSALVPGISPS